MSLAGYSKKLVEIGSQPLGFEEFGGDLTALQARGGTYLELANILRQKDGFYAFESALHFRPWRTSSNSVGIVEWNSEAGWRSEYGELAIGCLFFAEDLFAGQFCLKDGEVWQFDPETGDLKRLGTTLEDWARSVMQDYKFLTGQPLANEWQRLNGSLPFGARLVPKVPFVLGGEFSVSNLTLMDAERGMRVRGNLARQLHSLPDGAQIQFLIRE